MKKILLFVLLILLIFSLMAGCLKQERYSLASKNPITLNIWHNYGGQMKFTMDAMVDEFNSTIGAEKGIFLSVTSISGSSTLHEKLIMAANKDPGAPTLPDITTVYPKTAIILAKKGLLVDLGQQFSTEELNLYIPQFIREGQLIDDQLYVLPTAKSTEVLYINKTLFQRFCQETDISYVDMETFEGIINAAAQYYKWTDQQTPEIENDGKMFFMPDSLFNLTMVGYKQLGDEFIKEQKANLSSPIFAKIWACYFEPAVRGHLAIFDGYASDLAKTGDIICATGSTAGVLFYPPTITYADNNSEPVEYAIMPYPTFKGGKKVAIQRGAGMSIIKSTKEKEYAASIFLKWFTAPQQNLNFVASTGYLPVTQKAFGEIMDKEIQNIPDQNIKKLLITAMKMQKDYDFYIPPLFDGIDQIEKGYENKLKTIATQARGKYLDFLEEMDNDAAYDKVKLIPTF